MLIDKTHIRWGLTSAGILVLATAGYVIYALNADSHPSSGTIVGLMFGIVASAMMIFAGLLAVRNRFPTVRCGSAKFWLRGHLWLGALSFIFALFHAGFRFGSTLETALMIAFIVVIASGLHGLAMQQVLPRLLTSRVPLETFGQQIPFLCRRMQAESDMIVAETCGQLDCDHEDISDAAYNLADSLGRLRNGKEGTDFKKFLAETYSDSTSKKLPTSTVQTTPVEVAPAALPDGDKPDKAAPTKKETSPPASNIKAGGDDKPPKQDAPDRPMSKIEMMRAAAKNKKDDKQISAKKQENAAPVEPEVSAGKSQPVMESVERKTSAQSTPPAEVDPSAATMTTEVVSAGCPNCGKVLVLPDRSFLGRLARCPQCDQRFVLGGEEDSVVIQPAEEPAETSPSEPLSKIEQMRAAAAAKSEQKKVDDKPLSKVEQMRAAAAEKREQAENSKQQEDKGSAEKPLSKVEQMRAAAEKRKQAENGDKHLSKIEQMRAAAAEKKNQAEGTEKPLSKVEQMRAAAAAKKQQAAGGDKPLSKVEQMRAAAAAKKESASGGKPAQTKGAAPKKTPPRPKAKKPPKKTAIPAEPIPRADILKSFYLSSVRPFLSSDRKTAASMKSAVSPQVFAQTRNNLPPQLHDTLNRLQKLCDERRQFIIQKRLHWLLHSWLLVHIPATIALFVLFIVHVIVALRVIPWNQ